MHNPTRRPELLSLPMDEQLVILDPVSHQSHCLSPAALMATLYVPTRAAAGS